jgi:hypothetical protein
VPATQLQGPKLPATVSTEPAARRHAAQQHDASCQQPAETGQPGRVARLVVSPGGAGRAGRELGRAPELPGILTAAGAGRRGEARRPAWRARTAPRARSRRQPRALRGLGARLHTLPCSGPLRAGRPTVSDVYARFRAPRPPALMVCAASAGGWARHRAGGRPPGRCRGSDLAFWSRSCISSAVRARSLRPFLRELSGRVIHRATRGLLSG